MDLQSLVGLSESKAVARIKSWGMEARITRRDKRFFMGTCDFRANRVKLEIDNGKVTGATIG